MWITSKKIIKKRAILEAILPSEICKGPSTSHAGIRNVILVNDKRLATAKIQSDINSGSLGLHQLRPEAFIFKIGAYSRVISKVFIK